MGMAYAQWAKLQSTHKIYVVEITLLSGSGNKVIRVADDNVILDENIYRGAIAKGSIPSFERSIENLGYGKTNISLGKLKIINTNRWLDDDLQTYNWIGAEVVMRCGGQDLDFSEYLTAVKAYIKEIRYGDEIIELTLADKSMKLLRNVISSNTWDDVPVYSIVDDILTECGINSSDRDAAAWSQFTTDANMTAYVTTDGHESASALLDRILAPLMFWYGFTRDGLFQVALLSEATSSDYDIHSGVETMKFASFLRYPYAKHYWKIRLSYISTKPDTTTEISQEDSTIKNTYPIAMESSVKATVLRVADDAQTTLNRWWAMFSVQRWVIRIGLKAQGFMLGIGDAFSLTRERGNASGYFRIIKILDDFGKNRVTLYGLQ